jgi:hypothetical protein
MNICLRQQRVSLLLHLSIYSQFTNADMNNSFQSYIFSKCLKNEKCIFIVVNITIWGQALNLFVLPANWTFSLAETN